MDAPEVESKQATNIKASLILTAEVLGGKGKSKTLKWMIQEGMTLGEWRKQLVPHLRLTHRLLYKSKDIELYYYYEEREVNYSKRVVDFDLNHPFHIRCSGYPIKVNTQYKLSCLLNSAFKYGGCEASGYFGPTADSPPDWSPHYSSSGWRLKTKTNYPDSAHYHIKVVSSDVLTRLKQLFDTKCIQIVKRFYKDVRALEESGLWDLESGKTRVFSFTVRSKKKINKAFETWRKQKLLDLPPSAIQAPAPSKSSTSILTAKTAASFVPALATSNSSTLAPSAAVLPSAPPLSGTIAGEVQQSDAYRYLRARGGMEPLPGTESPTKKHAKSPEKQLAIHNFITLIDAAFGSATCPHAILIQLRDIVRGDCSAITRNTGFGLHGSFHKGKESTSHNHLEALRDLVRDLCEEHDVEYDVTPKGGKQ